jgi:hypothetical protein
MAAPTFEDDAGLAPRRKPLRVDAFVAELPVEALIGGVLAALTGRDVRALDFIDAQPILKRSRGAIEAFTTA